MPLRFCLTEYGKQFLFQTNACVHLKFFSGWDEIHTLFLLPIHVLLSADFVHPPLIPNHNISLHNAKTKYSSSKNVTRYVWVGFIIELLFCSHVHCTTLSSCCKGNQFLCDGVIIKYRWNVQFWHHWQNYTQHFLLWYARCVMDIEETVAFIPIKFCAVIICYTVHLSLTDPLLLC